MKVFVGQWVRFALKARSARFPLFERLGLITPDTEPHSILAQRTLHFDIHTPPRRYPANNRQR